MRTILELIRILVLMILFSAITWAILLPIYSINGTVEKYALLGAIAIFLLFFTLYRNKLQFTGWYKGKGRQKLSKNFTRIIISTSFVLLVSPFMISLLQSVI